MTFQQARANTGFHYVANRRRRRRRHRQWGSRCNACVRHGVWKKIRRPFFLSSLAGFTGEAGRDRIHIPPIKISGHEYRAARYVFEHVLSYFLLTVNLAGPLMLLALNAGGVALADLRASADKPAKKIIAIFGSTRPLSLSLSFHIRSSVADVISHARREGRCNNKVRGEVYNNKQS